MNRSLKVILFISCFFFLYSCHKVVQQSSAKPQANTSGMEGKTIHQFTVKDLEGHPFDFATLKGKKVMIVNTASECGNTPQYKDLQMIYDKYKDDNFVVVGFPANNFGEQEPGTNKEIAAFCERNYGVTFPMMAKISVKGNDIHPVYRFLTRKEENGKLDSEVTWNFQKYLLNEEGVLEKVIDPDTLPTHREVIEWIQRG